MKQKMKQQQQQYNKLLKPCPFCGGEVEVFEVFDNINTITHEAIFYTNFACPVCQYEITFPYDILNCDKPFESSIIHWNKRKRKGVIKNEK